MESPDGNLVTIMAAATARAVRALESGPDAGPGPGAGADAGPRLGAGAPARAGTTVRLEDVGRVDPEDFAEWVVSRYPPGGYRGAVVGSPHGGAAHLAAAAGVPWLPSGFALSVLWPGGAVDDLGGAVRFGRLAARPLLAAGAGVSVRQVHDPVGRGVHAGQSVLLQLRWRRLPGAYRRFLAGLRPAADVVLVRDTRTWPVLETGPGLTFQAGSPTSGLAPAEYLDAGPGLGQALRLVGGDIERWRSTALAASTRFGELAVEATFEESLRRWTRGPGGRRLRRVTYSRPEAMSNAAADILREWRRAGGGAADRLVVGCGRHVAAGLALPGRVPYWCEAVAGPAVTGLELWLAGGAPFRRITAFLDPAGVPQAATAGTPQWRSVLRFAARPRRGASMAVPCPVRLDGSPPVPREPAVAALRAGRATRAVRPPRPESPPGPVLDLGAALDRLGQGSRLCGVLVR